MKELLVIFYPRLRVRTLSLGILGLLWLTCPTTVRAAKTVVGNPAAKPAATAPHAHPASGASAMDATLTLGMAKHGPTHGKANPRPRF